MLRRNSEFQEPVEKELPEFCLEDRVQVLLQRRSDSGEWEDTQRGFVGTVVGGPSAGYDQESVSGVNVMPDVKLPHGHEYRNRHPRLITGEQFDYVDPSEVKWTLRFYVTLDLGTGADGSNA